MRSCSEMISLSSLPLRHGTSDLGKMHGADRGVTAGGLDVLVENLARHAGFLDGGTTISNCRTLLFDAHCHIDSAQATDDSTR